MEKKVPIVMWSVEQFLSIGFANDINVNSINIIMNCVDWKICKITIMTGSFVNTLTTAEMWI